LQWRRKNWLSKTEKRLKNFGGRALEDEEQHEHEEEEVLMR
jgi:hypothetical protein